MSFDTASAKSSRPRIRKEFSESSRSLQLYEAEAVPLVHAQLAMRHPVESLRRATVKTAPDWITCFP
jgi:hypothetical protein